MEQNIIDFLTVYFGYFDKINFIRYSIKSKNEIYYSYKIKNIFILFDIKKESIIIRYYDEYKNTQPILNNDKTEEINQKFLIYNRKRKIFKINERNNRT